MLPARPEIRGLPGLAKGIWRMNLNEIPILETQRLRLRPLRGSDLDDYAAMHVDPEVVRYFGPGSNRPWDRGRSWRHLAFLLGHWELGGCGTWAVERRENREFVGVAGFYEPDGWPGFELAGKMA